MAWVAGTVAVTLNQDVWDSSVLENDGVTPEVHLIETTGSGQALALFNAMRAEYEAYEPAVFSASWSLRKFRRKELEALRLGRLQFLAFLARAIASMATYATSNAVATVTVHPSDSGLQTTPNPNNPSTATLGPASNKTLTGSIA
jgi:hypothetical protein